MMMGKGRKWHSVVCEEPYRLFFPIGILAGMVGSGHWAAYGMGFSQSYSNFYHASVQVWLYIGSFALGFLATAIPRFSGTWSAHGREITAFLVLEAGMLVFLASGHFVMAEVFFITWLFALFLFIGRRFLAARVPQMPLEFFWIPVAFLHAATGVTLILFTQQGWVKPVFMAVGLSMETQGFLLSLVLGVGGFLGPRLFGNHVLTPGSDKRFLYEMKRRKLTFQVAAASLIYFTFWMKGPAEDIYACALRAAAVTAVLFQNGVLRPPRLRNLFAGLLWFSFWMVPFGCWMEVIFPAHRAAVLHVLFIAGFSLMTFTVSTLVVLNHAGESSRLSEPLWIFKLVAASLALALAARLAAVFFVEYHFWMLGISAVCWIASGVGWLVFSAPLILRMPKSPAHSKQHEGSMQEMIRAC